MEHVDYRHFMTEHYPEVFFFTTPSDDLLYQHTREMHQFMETHHIPHQYREYIGKENKLDHVFNVTYPDYAESREANDDIIRFFLQKRNFAVLSRI